MKHEGENINHNCTSEVDASAPDIFAGVVRGEDEHIKPPDKNIINFFKTNDIFSYSIQLLENKANGRIIFKLLDVLQSFSVILILDINTFLLFCDKIYERLILDYAQFIQYDLFEKILQDNPDKVLEIEKALLSEARPFTPGYIAQLFLFKAKTNDGTQKELLQFCSTLEEKKLIGIVNALANLDYTKPSFDKNLTIEAFDSLYKKATDEDLQACIVWANSRMFDNNSDPVLLLQYKNATNVSAKLNIARFLSQKQKEFSNETWYDELLLSLVDIGCKYKGPINPLDSILAHKLKNKEYDIFERFIIDWIEKTGATKNIGFDKFFNSVTSQLFRNKKYLQHLLLSLFMVDKPKHITVAKELISLFTTIHKVEYLYFLPNEISKLSAESIDILLHRLYGYLVGVESLCPLILSIIIGKLNDGKILNELIAPFFYQFVAESYPLQVCDFLTENIWKLSGPNLNIKKTLDKLLKESENIKSAFYSRPVIKELSISGTQNRMIIEHRFRINTKILERAEKQSIFADIYQKFPIKYGCSVMNYIHTGTNERHIVKNPMTEFSHAIVYPVTEFLQPVEDALHRSKFSRYKPGMK